MFAKMRSVKCSCAVMAVAFGALMPQSALAYLAAGFLQVPGVEGGSKAAAYKHWIPAAGHYWKRSDVGRIYGGRNNFEPRAFFSGPAAPQSGGDELIFSVSKSDPAVRALMKHCADHVRLPEVVFAESSALTRGLPQVGDRPDSIPAWFRYTLKDAEISECPVVASAPEQAFVLKFNNIEWQNYKGPPEGSALPLQPASLLPLQQHGKTRSFVLTWIGRAQDVDDKQCPATTDKPSVTDYLTYLTGADREKAQATLTSSGGALDYGKGTVGRRGPGFINICFLPGILPSPTHPSPISKLALGLDLDGDGGTRSSRKDVANFRNYTSPDGRKGIDNQLFTATGCVPGMRGKKGFLDQYGNEEIRNGFVSPLLMISGIDDERNDDSVDITILYSKDPMAKNASGRDILPDYSFRITREPQFAHYAHRLHGRIVNGVIETDPVEKLEMNYSYAQLMKIYKARLRMEIGPDGSLKGLLGGYYDWRRFMVMSGDSQNEQLSGFQCPGLYHALKNAADGLKNPETGENDGISMALEIEGKPAYIPASETAALFVKASSGKQSGQ